MVVRGGLTTDGRDNTALALGDISRAGGEGIVAGDSTEPDDDATASDRDGTAPLGDSAEPAEDGAISPAVERMGPIVAGKASAGHGAALTVDDETDPAGEGKELPVVTVGGLGRETPSC